MPGSVLSFEGEETPLEIQLNAALSIQPGTSIRTAEAVLRESGFSCVQALNGDSGPYLECNASADGGFNLTLIVRVYHEKGKVTRREIRGKGLSVGSDPSEAGKEWEVEPADKDNHVLFWPQLVRQR
jgi:hypothetical protein